MELVVPVGATLGSTWAASLIIAGTVIALGLILLYVAQAMFQPSLAVALANLR